MTHIERVFIKGNDTEMMNKQIRLYRKYLERP
jgi:hypothetical protein